MPLTPPRIWQAIQAASDLRGRADPRSR
jgi:hypothetical protein